MYAVKLVGRFGWALVAAVLYSGAQAATDISTDPLNTYSAPSDTDVKPNVFFILDDSGSMDFDFMPDWACAQFSTSRSCNFSGTFPRSPGHEYLFRNAAYNGVYYDATVTYKQPVTIDSDGALDKTTYPSMTGVSTATGGDANASAQSPNWKRVKIDAYGVQSTSTANLHSSTTYPPYFFTTVAGEYCKEPTLRTCIAANAPVITGNPDNSYPYPAKVRWCSDSELTDCQGAFSSDYRWVRSPSPSTAEITISGSWSDDDTQVSGIKVDGKQIMAGSINDDDSRSVVASRIAARINECTVAATGNCETSGYRASSSDSTVTIIAPQEISVTPVVTRSYGTMTFSATAFSKGDVPGTVHVTVLTSSNDSYPYPGSNRKHEARTDCEGDTCTFAEEMTNFANWFTYYRTRMQLMKTAASNAFATIDSATDLANNVSRFRVGYMSINNSTSADFLNLSEFKTTHKYAWFQKLKAAKPNGGTPLREALAKAGRLYAGMLNGTSLHGTTVVDPLQYSCQQNFSILSSDGFWNGSEGYKLNGSSSVGNQDGWMDRPYSDGASSWVETRTKELRSRTVTTKTETRTSQLQETTSQLQVSESRLQRREKIVQRSTSSNSGASWSGWTAVSACTWKTSGRDRTRCRYVDGEWANVSSCSQSSFNTRNGNNQIWRGGDDCQYTDWTPWTATNACSAAGRDNSNPYSVAVARQCQYETVQTSDVESCSPTGTDSSGIRTTCGYTGWSSWTETDSCTPVAESTRAPYTVGTARQCNTEVVRSPWVSATSCTASSTQECGYTTSWSGWQKVASCTPVAASSGPDYTVETARECQYKTNGGTSDTLADVAAYYYNTDLRSPNADDGTGTCDGPIIPPATTRNNLCDDNVPPNGRDVASTQHMTTFTLGLGAQGQMLYAPQDGKDYWNDTSGDFYDVRKGTTPDHSRGICLWQASGQCTWPTPSSDSVANIDDLWHAAVNGRGTYFSAGSPETLAEGLNSTLEAIVNTPRPGTAAAAASSNPNVSAEDNFVFSSSYRSVDWYGDLVRQRLLDNGDLSAENWSAMKLLDCAVTPWKANTNYEEGSVFKQGARCYSVTDEYVSGESFDGTPTGVDGSNTVMLYEDESAAAAVKVAATPLASRTIYTKGESGLVAFTWANLAEAQRTWFKKPHIAAGANGAGLSQFCTSGPDCLEETAQTATTVAEGGAAGEALVNFLRGDRTHEGTYFRKRKHVLGDIVSSEARYVQTPLFNYMDENYLAFKEAKKTRTAAVYVGANDGMVHAFNGQTGQELWAYIPSMVMPEIYKLADMNYATTHRFYVDGTPEAGDICPNAPASACSASDWKTILVGGLNRGGKGYYALDVTNPLSPKLLWEFTHANLGYAYGNPRITKLKDGTWVVLLSSGYNNSGGKGHLFVLNANTGRLIRTISTSAGTDAAPSGLARISAHAPNAMTDNTTSAAYGGDLFGNLWRFDINGDIGASGYEAHLLVQLLDEDDKPQPVTVKPLETTIGGKPVVYAGTGRYLGVSDIADGRKQTFYAIKDSLTDETLGNPRLAASKFVQQTLTSGVCPANTPRTVCEPGQIVRTGTDRAVEWSTDNGWFIDFLTAGERSVTDPSLGLGTLLFTTITPSGASANACGEPADTSSSFAYAVDYMNGGSLPGTNGVVAMGLGNGLVTRPVMVRQSDGTVRALIRRSSSTATGTLVITPPMGNQGSKEIRRVSWRPVR